MISTDSMGEGNPLAHSETQLRLLIDGVVDCAIYMIDPHGRIVTWNAGAVRIKGYEAGEIIGEHFSCFYTPEDQADGAPAANLANARETGRVEVEGWRVRKDGTQFWAHIIIDRITTADGQLLGFAKVTRDVTTQRDARKELDEAREALFFAQKMDALGKLTGGVAHDFNNLLMAIQGTLDLMELRSPDDERMGALLRIARASVDRGAGLTRRMLGFARRQSLRPEAVDPAMLVHGLLGLMSATAGPEVEVATQVAPDVPPIFADPHELELALLNLVINARDALPEGGHIVVGVESAEGSQGDQRDKAGWYVCLSVTDDGTGMDEATRSRAMDPFFTTKETGKGIGLGLSTVHGLAVQSGGWVVLKSEPGQGTRVELWLPGLAAEAGIAEVGYSSVGAPGFRPLRVLFVDDDPLVHQTVAALLENLGHTVLSAQRGQQALDLLEGGAACDVLLSDFAMPGMTGRDLAHAARALRPNLPVIIATGYAELDPAELPGVLRLSKPFDRDALTVALRTVAASVTS
ncbi:PAS domain S-box protein [Luteibacter aegosomaticola]|uniref:ATP-binding protein n=1 Tax=Luteibacter aegosomaticola TaxID=2911538 RepID=UPI001FF7B0E7|nr:ATP-binding protein [Luteibacter aegosomaticola]UPG88209.1 PAS domain S-box protein [Luteibacter aegosomaticola]